MGKKSKGGNRANSSGKKGQHTIRNKTSRKIVKGTAGGASAKSGASIMVVMPGQSVNLLDTLKKKFPLAVEAITGKYIDFQNMKFEDMMARIEQFFKTMNITFELPKGNKDVSVIREMLSGPLERAETDLAHLAW